MEKDHTAEHGRPLTVGFWKQVRARILPLLKNPLVLKAIWWFFREAYWFVRKWLDED